MTNLIHDEKATLLLVDDDVDFLNALRHAMRKRGYLVTLANSAESAFELAKVEPPEFAVVDLKMSGNSGLVLVRQLGGFQANNFSSLNRKKVGLETPLRLAL